MSKLWSRFHLGNITNTDDRMIFERKAKCFFFHNFKYEEPFYRYYWANGMRITFRNAYIYSYVDGVLAKTAEYEVIQDPIKSFTVAPTFLLEHEVFVRLETLYEKPNETIILKGTFPNGGGLPDELLDAMYTVDDVELRQVNNQKRVKLKHDEYERYLNAFLASMGFEHNMLAMFEMCYEEITTQTPYPIRPAYFENFAKNSMLLSVVALHLNIRGYRIFTQLVNDMDRYAPRRRILNPFPPLLCVICNDVIGVGKVSRSLICGHVFHRGCIEYQVFYARACPLCFFRVPIDFRRIVAAFNMDVENRTNFIKTNFEFGRIRYKVPPVIPHATGSLVKTTQL